MAATAIVDNFSAAQDTAAPIVREMTQGVDARWDAFVMQCPQATFFHRAGWKEVIERAFGHRTHFLYAERNGNIEGVLPLAHVHSRLFGNSLASLPFCVYGGIVATTQEAREALDKAAQALAVRLGVDCLEYRNISPQHADWPHKELYVTFRKPLDADVEVNMNNIPRKQRAMVRKGINNGLTGEIDTNVDRFYEAYAHSVHALGTPVFSKRYFKILTEVFKKDCDILTILSKEGELVGSVMNFYFRDEVLPYYGGGTDKSRQLAGNDFMYWELMRRSCERGVRLFDYGRSKQGSGAYSFKKNWGFEPTPLNYEYFLVKAKSVPEINPMNPKYQMFIKLWKKMPLGMTKIIGPHIVKNLG